MSFTLIIILLTVVTSLAAFPYNIPTIEAIRQPHWFRRYCFNPYAVTKFRQYERFVTYGFLHADWMHLLFNMLTLYFFGRYVEKFYIHSNGEIVGKLIFLLFYISGIVVSTLYDFFANKRNSAYNAVGASGAVSGVVFTFILFLPDVKLYFYFIPIGIPGWLFGILYLAFSIYMARRGTDNIGHMAHFWGSLWGLVFPFFFFDSSWIIQNFITRLFGYYY